MADNTVDVRSRRWLITINNPLDKGYTHDELKKILGKFSCIYWCMSDEEGLKEHTPHIHIYMHLSGAARWSTCNRRFSGGVCQPAKGTPQQCRDYVFKEGKYSGSEKEDTNFKESHEEYGDCPQMRDQKSDGYSELLDMVESGMSTMEIIKEYPWYLTQIDRIDKLRQMHLQEKYKLERRELEVIYIWGPPAVGKTRFVMDTYGYDKVYRITDYQHPFDSYNYQDVVAFEEFHNSLDIVEMLKYLDVYPVEASARYYNRQLVFHKVYILTNVDLRDQYKYYQLNDHLTWKAFIRRINQVWVMTGQETVKMSTKDYLREYFPVFTDYTPFEDTKEVRYDR